MNAGTPYERARLMKIGSKLVYQATSRGQKLVFFTFTGCFIKKVTAITIIMAYQSLLQTECIVGSVRQLSAWFMIALTWQMGDWADEWICLRSVEERKRLAKSKFPKKFNAVTLILDGKFVKLRKFNRTNAAHLYATLMVKKDYLCHKVKPKCVGLLTQVIFVVYFAKLLGCH